MVYITAHVMDHVLTVRSSSPLRISEIIACLEPILSQHCLQDLGKAFKKSRFSNYHNHSNHVHPYNINNTNQASPNPQLAVPSPR